ncbi:hypothetical protein [Streptomyces sp. NPDC058280]
MPRAGRTGPPRWPGIRRRGDQERRARHAIAGVDKISKQLGRWLTLAA